MTRCPWVLFGHFDYGHYVSFAWHACVKLFPVAASLLSNCGQQWEARLTRFPLQIRDIRFCPSWIPFAWKINIVLLSDSAQSTLSTTQEKGSMLMVGGGSGGGYVSSKILKQKTQSTTSMYPFLSKTVQKFFWQGPFTFGYLRASTVL